MDTNVNSCKMENQKAKHSSNSHDLHLTSNNIMIILKYCLFRDLFQIIMLKQDTKLLLNPFIQILWPTNHGLKFVAILFQRSKRKR